MAQGEFCVLKDNVAHRYIGSFTQNYVHVLALPLYELRRSHEKEHLVHLLSPVPKDDKYIYIYIYIHIIIIYICMMNHVSDLCAESFPFSCNRLPSVLFPRPGTSFGESVLLLFGERSATASD